MFRCNFSSNCRIAVDNLNISICMFSMSIYPRNLILFPGINRTVHETFGFLLSNEPIVRPRYTNKCPNKSGKFMYYTLLLTFKTTDNTMTLLQIIKIVWARLNGVIQVILFWATKSKYFLFYR